MSPSALPQASRVTPRTPIKFGRYKTQPGQLWWIVSSPTDRATCIKIAREGGSWGNAVAFSLSDFDANFQPYTK